MTVILDNISVTYDKDTFLARNVLKDISCEFLSKACNAVIGPSGAGKSTLAKVVAGLVSPSSGRISISGRVGMVMQYPEEQLFESTILDDVMFGPLNLGLDANQAMLKAKKALSLVGLDANEVGRYSPFKISGGQKRRVAIAGILAMEPDILILDEPTAGLDPVAKQELVKLLTRLRADFAIILISHDMNLVYDVAEQILVLNQGKLIKAGTPLTVFFDSEVVRANCLELPEKVKLIKELELYGLTENQIYSYLCKELKR